MRLDRLAVIALALSVDLVMGASTAPVNPHIVFVLVDDWGFHNPAIKTPNFDKLANEGLILGRHYVYNRGGGRYLRLGGGGQRGWCVRKHAHARRVWEHAPPEIYFKIRCSEIASEAIFVPKCH